MMSKDYMYSTGTPNRFTFESELGQPFQSYFGLYRKLTITKAAEECAGIVWRWQNNLKYQNIFQLNHIEKDNFRLNSDK